MRTGDNNSYCDAIDLAYYVADRYYDKYHKAISNIKLQKALYFLFAYWGGFVRKGVGKATELNVKYRPYLFSNKIEAWVYGPVIPEVYKQRSDIKFVSAEIPNDIELDSDIKEFVDGLCDEMFEVSDFKLVEIAHQDECWKRHYNDNQEWHNEEIPKEEIIEEYVPKI